MIKNKLFLIILKYIPHILAFLYVIYTMLGFFGIDAILLGQLINLAFFPWTFMLLTSYIFKFCYVHRLPLWYIGINEVLTRIDYYIGIPIDDVQLFLVHLVILAIIIFGYSFYYVKYKLKRK